MWEVGLRNSVHRNAGRYLRILTDMVYMWTTATNKRVGRLFKKILCRLIYINSDYARYELPNTAVKSVSSTSYNAD